MIVIFMMSAQPAKQSANTSLHVGRTICTMFVPGYDGKDEQEQLKLARKIDHPLRKTAHATEFAILAVLIFSSKVASSDIVYLYKTNDQITIRKKYIRSWILTVVYAVSDELHQYFVPGRACQIRDVLIDSFGAFIGLLIIWVVRMVSASDRKTTDQDNCYAADTGSISYDAARRRLQRTAILFSLIVIIAPPILFLRLLHCPDTAEELGSFIGLVLSAWSLGTAVGIALLIYWMQKLDVIRQHEETRNRAVSVYKKIAKSTIDYLLCPPKQRDAADVSFNREKFMSFYEFLPEVITDETQRIWFDQLVAKADTDARLNREQRMYDPEIFRFWLRPVVQSSKYQKIIYEFSEKYNLLDVQTYSILNLLNITGACDPYQESLSKLHLDKNLLLEHSTSIQKVNIPDIISQAAITVLKMYNVDYGKIPVVSGKTNNYILTVRNYTCTDIRFSGTICEKNGKIYDGYEKGHPYDGYYQNGSYHGIGCLYKKDDETGGWSKYLEGYFDGGSLRYGIRYGYLKQRELGEFKRATSTMEHRLLLCSGTMYNYTGHKLSDGEFGVDMYNDVINGVEYDYIIEDHNHTLSPFISKDYDLSDDDENVDIELWTPYFSNDFSPIWYSALENILCEDNDSEKFFIADCVVRDRKAVSLHNIRYLKDFMRDNDPENYEKLFVRR